MSTLLYQSSRTQTHKIDLKSRERGEKLKCVLLNGQDDTICHIFQSKPSEVSIENLPMVWEVGSGRKFDTIQLPCTHTFNPTAVALHFMAHDMRCPVCRCGPENALDAECLPLSVREALKGRGSEIRESIRQDTEHDNQQISMFHDSQVEVDLIEENLTMAIEIVVGDGRVLVLQCPIRVYDLENINLGDPTPNQFHIQRSFNRLLGSYLQKYRQQAKLIRFNIRHPVILNTIRVGTDWLDFPLFYANVTEANQTMPSFPIMMHTTAGPNLQFGVVQCQFRSIEFRARSDQRFICCPPPSNPPVLQSLLFLSRSMVVDLCLSCIVEHVQVQLTQNVPADVMIQLPLSSS